MNPAFVFFFEDLGLLLFLLTASSVVGLVAMTGCDLLAAALRRRLGVPAGPLLDIGLTSIGGGVFMLTLLQLLAALAISPGV